MFVDPAPTHWWDDQHHHGIGKPEDGQAQVNVEQFWLASLSNRDYRVQWGEQADALWGGCHHLRCAECMETWSRLSRSNKDYWWIHHRLCCTRYWNYCGSTSSTCELSRVQKLPERNYSESSVVQTQLWDSFKVIHEFFQEDANRSKKFQQVSFTRLTSNQGQFQMQDPQWAEEVHDAFPE